MEKLTSILQENVLIKEIRNEGIIYCLECDVEVEFFPSRKTANCPRCNKLIHRKSIEAPNSDFVCVYCNNFLVVPYIEQVNNEYKLHHVVCDSCEKSRKFEVLSRKDGMEYITFQAKFRKDNDIPFYKRWENINQLIANAERSKFEVRR